MTRYLAALVLLGLAPLAAWAEKPARLLVNTTQRPSGEKCGWLFRLPPEASRIRRRAL